MILKDQGGGGYPGLDGKWPVRRDCLFLNQEVSGRPSFRTATRNQKRLPTRGGCGLPWAQL